jgi:tRNA(adenine34) deaminase
MNDSETQNEGGSDLFHPHRWFMRKALMLARKAAAADEVPVGAVIVQGDRLIAQAWNQVELLHDPTAHAEMIAITQAASALGDWRLNDTVLYVTKEPCPMCAGAIVLARIPVVVWGMSDPLRGGAISKFNILQSDTLNHRVDCITGVLEAECKDLMQDFFRAKREESRRRQQQQDIEDTLAPPPDERWNSN